MWENGAYFRGGGRGIGVKATFSVVQSSVHLKREEFVWYSTFRTVQILVLTKTHGHNRPQAYAIAACGIGWKFEDDYLRAYVRLFHWRSTCVEGREHSFSVQRTAHQNHTVIVYENALCVELSGLRDGPSRTH